MNHPPVDAPTAIAEIKKALATYEALVAQEAAVITSLMDMDQSEQAKTRHHAFQKFIIGTEAAFKQVRMEFNHAISDHAMSRVRAQLNVQSDRESASPFENRYLQLNYLYRDADNYKKAGTALFLSHKGMKAEEANQAVAPHLIDETFFLAEVWGG
jgi:GTPase involved in cell partitioning and DNA repair